eukprot:4005119-Amphidinium_carterae.1
MSEPQQGGGPREPEKTHRAQKIQDPKRAHEAKEPMRPRRPAGSGGTRGPEDPSWALPYPEEPLWPSASLGQRRDARTRSCPPAPPCASA